MQKLVFLFFLTTSQLAWTNSSCIDLFTIEPGNQLKSLKIIEEIRPSLLRGHLIPNYTVSLNGNVIWTSSPIVQIIQFQNQKLLALFDGQTVHYFKEGSPEFYTSMPLNRNHDFFFNFVSISQDQLDYAAVDKMYDGRLQIRVSKTLISKPRSPFAVIEYATTQKISINDIQDIEIGARGEITVLLKNGQTAEVREILGEPLLSSTEYSLKKLNEYTWLEEIEARNRRNTLK